MILILFNIKALKYGRLCHLERSLPGNPLIYEINIEQCSGDVKENYN